VQFRARTALFSQNRGGVMTNKGPDARDIEVGRRVRVFRLQKGLSQEKLGDALGITFQQVQKYEKGTNRIGAGRLQRIAEVLDVPVTSFFTPQKTGATASNEIVELLDTAAGLRLLRAYLRIPDPRTRQAVIYLVEKIARD
jgi:transcriptional regulator with XRE-family HTH domain